MSIAFDTQRTLQSALAAASLERQLSSEGQMDLRAQGTEGLSSSSPAFDRFISSSFGTAAQQPVPTTSQFLRNYLTSIFTLFRNLTKQLTGLLPKTPVNPEELIGRSANEALQELRNQRGVSTRIVGPGQLVTMDYDPNRLNLRTDSSGLIKSVNWG